MGLYLMISAWFHNADFVHQNTIRYELTDLELKFQSYFENWKFRISHLDKENENS